MKSVSSFSSIDESEALLQIKPLPGAYDIRAGRGLYRAITAVI